MQENAEEGNAREAELLEVLSAYAEPRVVSYRFVVGFVLLGLLSCVSLAWAVAGAPRREPLRLEPPPTPGFQRGVGAFHAADWHEALRLMREAQAALDEPLPRVEDFIERLELILRDEERLARVEQALAADDPERALAVAALIAPNSPLFAQAEGLERKARSQLHLPPANDRSALEARAAAGRSDPHAPAAAGGETGSLGGRGEAAPPPGSEGPRGKEAARGGRRARRAGAGAARGADRRNQAEAW